MTATGTANPGAKSRARRPTQAEAAAKDAQIAALQAQLAAGQAVPGKQDAQVRPAQIAAVNGNGSHAGIPEILRFTTSDPDDVAPEARIPLFSIDGVEYTIPAHPPMTTGLRCQQIIADDSVPFGVASIRADNYMMTALLGEDGYAALLAYAGRDLTPEALKLIVATCSRITFGALEDEDEDGPKGRSTGA